MSKSKEEQWAEAYGPTLARWMSLQGDYCTLKLDKETFDELHTLLSSLDNLLSEKRAEPTSPAQAEYEWAGECYCSDRMSGGLPCLPWKCPNVPAGIRKPQPPAAPATSADPGGQDFLARAVMCDGAGDIGGAVTNIISFLSWKTLPTESIAAALRKVAGVTVGGTPFTWLADELERAQKSEG